MYFEFNFFPIELFFGKCGMVDPEMEDTISERIVGGKLVWLLLDNKDSSCYRIYRLIKV